ncbi:MAG TPA: ABC transporter permease [Candidatus Polarisedimenticolaceae bacterium]|nr:ABC transporter permease [Candidatus Polarisedimenticolaceae bacterium]
MRGLMQDLRYGLRTLRREPGFAAVAVLTLALGIGANIAIFSVVHAVLLHPLPYAEPERLVLVLENNLQKGWDQFAVAPANFADWREQVHGFSGLAAFQDRWLILGGGPEPERVLGARVSAGLLDVLGQRPLFGRPFRPEEFQPGQDRVVQLSHALWQRRFGADPAAVGRALVLGGESYTIVGVLPPDVPFPRRTTALWVPLALDAEASASRGSHFLVVIGRLGDGVALEQARSELGALAARLAAQYPDTNAGWGVHLASLEAVVVGGTGRALWILFGAVGCLLSIGCANVANLLLSRAAARRGEIAVRVALGAGRLRLVRQLLTESLLYAVLAAGLAVLLAAWTLDLLQARVAVLGLPVRETLALHAPVLLFALGLTLLTALTFGLVPALQATRVDLQETLKQGGRTGRGGGRSRLPGLLVVSEVAVALVLLLGAGLLLRSLWSLQRVAPGLETADRLAVPIDLPRAKYGEAARMVQFYDQALERLRALPGVSGAAAVSVLPLSGRDELYSFLVEGEPEPPTGQTPSANYYAVSPDYFRTLGIPLLSGRPFLASDRAETQSVAIVSESLVRRWLPDQDPLGRQIRLGLDSDTPRTIVGVVGDVRHYGLDSPVTFQVYEPYAQRPKLSMTLVLRGPEPVTGLTAAARRELLQIDAEQPPGEVRTLEQVLSSSIAQPRFRTTLFAAFAAVALVLATSGIYGVGAYWVTQRTREIGVRVALGARRRDVLRLVLGQGLRRVLAGVGLGVVGAFALTRVMKRLLFEVTPTDPLTFVLIPCLLVAVGLVACYLPARRAVAVDPMTALRCE